jgi:hypothetical protein
MSRSPRDWEKANRDQNVKQSRRLRDLERPLEGGMPAQLREKLQERKLKPFFIERVQSVKPETKGVLKAVEYISESRISLLARNEQKDGEVRCQCQMEFHSFVDLERGEDVLRSVFDAKAYHVLDKAVFVFWINCPQSLLTE